MPCQKGNQVFLPVLVNAQNYAVLKMRVFVSLYQEFWFFNKSRDSEPSLLGHSRFRFYIGKICKRTSILKDTPREYKDKWGGGHKNL